MGWRYGGGVFELGGGNLSILIYSVGSGVVAVLLLVCLSMRSLAWIFHVGGGSVAFSGSFEGEFRIGWLFHMEGYGITGVFVEFYLSLLFIFITPDQLS